MQDFEVQRCTRRCADSGRELAPNDVFYSVLVRQGASVLRLDYSQEAWKGPPEEALGWWKSRMPSAQAQRARLAPNDVLLQVFEEFLDRPDQADLCYVLALLLVRRRVLRLEPAEAAHDGVTADGAAHDGAAPDGVERLRLVHSKSEQPFCVPVVSPTGPRIEEIQDELARLLYAEPD